MFKVGTELAAAEGWVKAINYVHSQGGEVFADAKLADIPETVAKTTRIIVATQPAFLSAHLSIGNVSLNAVAKHKKSTKILGVSLLTSMSDAESQTVFGQPCLEATQKLLTRSTISLLDGVICSAQEIIGLQAQKGVSSLLKVTPGIRPFWADKNDQQRTVTPSQAVRAGADYLIIGRPITNPPSNVGSAVQAVERVIQEVSEAT
jgi:orotidine-5'-phosphate decarboxylase